ncbi:MAG: phosphoserine phosphatase SerB [Dermabacter sp.]|nr:phosphoserine phosphatase SerB [Dermabacter sp.]
MTSYRGLLASDVDSTFLTQEVIELVADHAGVRSRVEDITTRAMRGELDFAASLRERVSLLAGLDAGLLDEVAGKLQLRDGAREVVEAAHAAHWRIMLVSGGFTPIIAPLAASLGIHEVVANEFEVKDGLITGKVSGRIVTGEVKAAAVASAQQRYGIAPERTIAMGDGANDAAMMAHAAVRVGVLPKPALRPHLTMEVGASLRPVADLIARLGH